MEGGVVNLLARFLQLLGLGRSRSPGMTPARPLEPERVALVARLDGSSFGVNCHTARADVLRKLSAGGIRWYRLDVDWDLIEPLEGAFDWAALDACVEALQGQGAAMLGSIAYTPAWASGADPKLPRERRQGRMPRDPGRFLRFVEALLDRHPAAFHALAIWNEPNQEKYFGGTRQDYLRQILRPGLELLRSKAPGIVRCGPDLSSSPPKKPHQWLAAALDEAGPLLDVVTHHQYDGNERVDRRVEAIEQILTLIASRGFGDRELWITETGWKRGEVTPAQQADCLARMMGAMSARRRSWRKTFWFDSHGPGEGLLGTDHAPDQGQPYPVFDRYAQLIADSQPPGEAQEA